MRDSPHSLNLLGGKQPVCSPMPLELGHLSALCHLLSEISKNVEMNKHLATEIRHCYVSECRRKYNAA